MEVEKVFKTDYIENLFNQQLNASKQRNKEVGNNNNKDIDISCILSLNSVQSVKKEWINCTDIVPMVLSMQEGHKCYTFFSDIDKQMSKAIENNPQYLLKFDLQPMIKINIVGKYVNESHYNSGLDQNPANKMKPKVGVYIAVHDATILPDMIDINFRRLYLNEYLWIPFAKRIQQLQPPPYKTKCYQYADWSTSNNELSVIKNIKQNKYKSRGECFIYCMWRDLNHNRCANFYSIYTEQIMIKDSLLRNNSIKFCSDSNQSYEKYIKTKNLCLNQCPQGCHQETFFTQDTMAEKDVMSIFGNLGTTVAIPWSIQAIEYINHQPKWEFEELLGTLGGHVHIWLGVSVIQIIWFIIRLFEIQNYRLTAICINLRITNWGPLGAPTHAFLP